MQGDAIVLQEIFEFRQTGLEQGRVLGHFNATGYIPKSWIASRPLALISPSASLPPRRSNRPGLLVLLNERSE